MTASAEPGPTRNGDRAFLASRETTAARRGRAQGAGPGDFGREPQSSVALEERDGFLVSIEQFSENERGLLDSPLRFEPLERRAISRS